MSQKWNRLHAQEEVNVKLYQKDHNAQVREKDFRDLHIPMCVMSQKCQRQGVLIKEALAIPLTNVIYIAVYLKLNCMTVMWQLCR